MLIRELPESESGLPHIAFPVLLCFTFCIFFLIDVGAMEDDYNIIWSDEVNMDLDMGIDVSFVEDLLMDIAENIEVDCSDAFKTTEVGILFILVL